jgi:hypothetical protein
VYVLSKYRILTSSLLLSLQQSLVTKVFGNYAMYWREQVILIRVLYTEPVRMDLGAIWFASFLLGPQQSFVANLKVPEVFVRVKQLTVCILICSWEITGMLCIGVNK